MPWYIVFLYIVSIVFSTIGHCEEKENKRQCFFGIAFVALAFLVWTLCMKVYAC